MLIGRSWIKLKEKKSLRNLTKFCSRVCRLWTISIFILLVNSRNPSLYIKNFVWYLSSHNRISSQLPFSNPNLPPNQQRFRLIQRPYGLIAHNFFKPSMFSQFWLIYPFLQPVIKICNKISSQEYLSCLCDQPHTLQNTFVWHSMLYSVNSKKYH